MERIETDFVDSLIGYNEEVLRMGSSYIPVRMMDGINLYLLFGIEPGSFLFSVFANDFVRIAKNADDGNKDCLFGYAFFLYNYAPINAWGSEEHVIEWIKKNGLVGIGDNPSDKDKAEFLSWMKSHIRRLGHYGLYGVPKQIFSKYGIDCDELLKEANEKE